MLKKGANLKTTRRSPAEYSTDLKMLDPGQRVRNSDARMFEENEEEKE